ncbi:probable RNA-binding protein CG14230 [Palaemon carinicauda]|uniref:probable RNA-binding protein CG14230 n=1 Tax=Palaemon carinicauda TaxID=392227 RepID=UPI0035B5AC73
MRRSRLFVGGLGEGVDQAMLVSKLSPYGSIGDAEVKEKMDAEGNVTLRFAYVNIEASQDQLEQCIRSLNGSMWQGSSMRVEVAKESFLDRLKREREERQGHRHGGQNFSNRDGFRKPERYRDSGMETQGKDYEVIPNEKRKLWQQRMDPSNSQENVKVSSTPDGNDQLFAKRRATGKNRNEREEEMMASFKTFSSMWADTDEEEENEGFVMSNKDKKKLEEALSKKKEMADDDDESDVEAFDDVASEPQEKDVEEEVKKTPPKSADKKKNWGMPKPLSLKMKEADPSFKPMTRYDPTLQGQQINLFPQADETETNGAAAGLMISSLFKESKPKAEETPVEEPVKRRPFFLSPSDERIQEGLDWMLQNVQKKILPEYKAVEDDLYDVIKTRSVRAKRDMNKKADNESNHKRKNMEKWGIFKSAGTLMIEEQIYDHGWRLAEIIQEEKRKSGKNNVGEEENNRSAGSGERTGFRGHRGRPGGGRGQDQSWRDNENRGDYGNQRRNGGGFGGRGRGERDIRGAWFGRNRSHGGSTQDHAPVQA